MTDLRCRVSCSKGKDGLNRYVETRHVEGLKHDLPSVLPSFRRSEWAFGQQEIVVFWITPEVIEDALLPELLHGVPIVNLRS